MTNTPIRVIPVVDAELFRALAQLDASWLLQKQCPTTDDLWHGLSEGSWDRSSRIVIIQSPDVAGDDSGVNAVATAILTLANAGAAVVLVAPDASRAEEMSARVGDFAAHQGMAISGTRFTTVVDPTTDLVSKLRAALGGLVEIKDQPRAVDPADSDPIALPITEDIPEVGGQLPELPGVADSDVHSDFHPSASRELLMRPRPQGQTTITVTSSKGGSGKSTTSIMLASSITRASADAGRPLSVCLVDLDTRDGQVASMIGTFMPTALNIRAQPVWDEERIRRSLVHVPELGIDTLLAPIRPRTADAVGPDFYRVVIRSLQRMYDVVIMDTSVQYLDPLIAQVALVEADEILFVTNLAATAIQGMARALREVTAPKDESGLGIPREKIGILVNQSVADVGMEREQITAAGLGIPVVGVIPLATKDVLAATNLLRIHDLLDHSALAPAYNDLARTCLPHVELAEYEPTAPVLAEEPVASVPKKKGLLRR